MLAAEIDTYTSGITTTMTMTVHGTEYHKREKWQYYQQQQRQWQNRRKMHDDYISECIQHYDAKLTSFCSLLYM